MDLNKLQESWDHFPELSMEERPLLSSDLEKMATHNPFAGDFYLRDKLLARIIGGLVLWAVAMIQLRSSWRTDRADLYQQIMALSLLTYFIYFQFRLLFFINYQSLASLRLIPFLVRIEMLMEKYMHSFRIISVLAGCYLLAAFIKILSLVDSGASAGLENNGFYRWLIIALLSMGFYAWFLQTSMQKYKHLMMAVRSYREGIILAKPQKG